MLIAHKIEIQMTDDFLVYCKKASGIRRFVYNWGLETWEQHLANYNLLVQNGLGKDVKFPRGKTFARKNIRDVFNGIKKANYPWIMDVSKDVASEAIDDLCESFERCFKNTSKFPKKKKKNKCKDSFRLTTDIRISSSLNKIYIAKFGWIKLKEKLRFKGKIKSFTISRKADKWFVAILVEVDSVNMATQPKNQRCVGIDLGVRTYATLSDGTKIEPLRPLRKRLKVLRRKSRSFSRKVVGSKNKAKAHMKLAMEHMRIANMRNDFIHKLTTWLVDNYAEFVIEDLDIQSMLKDKNLAMDIADASFYEFRRQLTYKCKWYGRILKLADRYYATTQRCSSCGKPHPVSRSTTVWTCNHCSVTHDRDLNAAINLEHVPAGSYSVI